MEEHYTLAKAYREVASQAAHLFHETSQLTLDDRTELHQWASEHLPLLHHEIERAELPSDIIARHLALDMHLSRNY
jgi:hypothetical protein